MQKDIAVDVCHVTKEYRMGVIGHDTLNKALAAKWARLRGKEDPNSKIGEKVFDSNERFLALDDVSFQVQQGDMLGIVGSNGAGKSTLLKILSRITTPTNGSVESAGRIASLLEVGTGFHPELTGRENIYMNGAILGMKKQEIDSKFDEIVDFSGVERFIDTPVKRYSSGMYVRLAFAIAAHLDSEILILDEVLAVGDAKYQKKCLQKIESISRNDGRTILFVSHAVASVRRLCSKCLWLDHGRVVDLGNTDDILNRYTGVDEVGYRCRVDWPDTQSAPQNQSILLRSVCLCDEDGYELREINTHTPFYVAIEYTAKSADAYAGFSCIFRDELEEVVCSSLSNLEAQWYGKPLGGGTFRSVCAVPADFFNNITLALDLNFFGKNYTDLQSVPCALKFTITDDAALRGDYTYGFGGFLRPRLTWETKRI